MECLITKLNGTVDDSTLLKLNEIRISFVPDSKKVDNPRVKLGPGIKVRAINNGCVGTTSGNATLKETTTVSDYVYLSDDLDVLSIENKHDIISFDIQEAKKCINFDLKQLEYCEALSYISIGDEQGVVGNIGVLFKHISRDILDERERKISIYLGENSGICGSIEDIEANILNVGGQYLSVYGIYTPLEGTSHIIAPSSLVKFNRIDLDNLSYKASSDNTFNIQFGDDQVYGNIEVLKGLNCTEFAFNNLYKKDWKSYLKGDLVATMNSNIKKNYMAKYIKVYTDNDNIQDLSKLNSNFTLFDNTGSTSTQNVPCKWTKRNEQSGHYILGIAYCHFYDGTEGMFMDQAQLELNPAMTQSYMKVIIITAHDLARATENITTAIENLSSKGITVSVTYAGTALASAKTLQVDSKTNDQPAKYAIVYNGNELIIEPTDLSNTTVSAAYDCNYKEFDSLDDARAFISSNGLVKMESNR